MASEDSSFLGQVADIFTGGLEVVLGDEIDRRRRGWDKGEPPIVGGQPLYVVGDGGAVQRGAASVTVPSLGGVPLPWITAGVALLVVLIAVVRR